MKIAVVVGTIREGRQSLKVGQYLVQELNKRAGITGELVDLKELDLPILTERSHYMKEEDRPAGLVTYREHIVAADGVIVVAPEYNGGYPAALKNAFDALHPEYRRKPFAITSVSSGYGGYTVITQLREIINRVGAFVVPTTFMARNASTAFDESGAAVNEFYDKGANKLIDDVLWFAEAINRQKQSSES